MPTRSGPRSHEIANASSPAGRPAARLGDRARAAIRLRHLSRRTEDAYVQWMQRYYEFHERRHPGALGPDHVTVAVLAAVIGARLGGRIGAQEVRSRRWAVGLASGVLQVLGFAVVAHLLFAVVFGIATGGAIVCTFLVGPALFFPAGVAVAAQGIAWWASERRRHHAV